MASASLHSSCWNGFRAQQLCTICLLKTYISFFTSTDGATPSRQCSAMSNVVEEMVGRAPCAGKWLCLKLASNSLSLRQRDERGGWWSGHVVHTHCFCHSKPRSSAPCICHSESSPPDVSQAYLVYTNVRAVGTLA